MKHLTVRKNCSDEAMKRLTLLKNWSDEALNASLPRFIASSSLQHCQHYINPCINCHKTGKTFQHICKGNDDDVFRLCYGNYGNNGFFFGNCQWNSLLNCFYVLIFFSVKALRQWRQIREAMKRWNVNYGKKLKQCSNEAFNAGKEIEAMKRLTLHRITALLLLPSFDCE